MNDPVHDAAPCFSQFWRASELNPTRALMMHQRIEEDAAHQHDPPRPRLAGVAHPLPTPDASVMDAWRTRRSVRAFSSEPVDVTLLSQLLWPLARRPDGGRGLASGGAKYPLQVHVIGWGLSEAGQACPARLTWYDPLRHGLSDVGPAPTWSVIKPVLGVNMDRPAAVLVVTAQAGPHVNKYGERGGRFVMLEVGSWLGAWQAETARAGLGGVVIGAYQDQALLRHLGPHVSGVDEAPGGGDSEHLVAAVYALGWPAP